MKTPKKFIVGTLGKVLRANLASERVCGAWVDAKHRRPVGRKVIVAGAFSEERYITLAEWYPAGTLDAEMWDDSPDDWWDDEGDNCRCPYSAWWEVSAEGEIGAELIGVKFWMPLPVFPKIQEGDG